MSTRERTVLPTSGNEPNTRGEVELQDNKTDEEMENGIGVRGV